MRKLRQIGEETKSLAKMPAHFGCDDDLPALVDEAGRNYTYLRLSLTDRCDFACIYCMPEGGESNHALRKDLLSFEEITRVVDIFARMGTRRVRFTGGEPFVRRGLTGLIKRIHAQSPTLTLAMTTNASQLAKRADILAKNGLGDLNISLDSLKEDRFRNLTRKGDLKCVLHGIDAALNAGLNVKLNTVVMRGKNDDELEAIVDYAWTRNIVPRFIELMPIGEGSRLPFSELFVPADEMMMRLANRIEQNVRDTEGPTGPARYARSKHDAKKRVGFITAMSKSFCENCNRVRISAAGDIRACLASRKAVSLRDLMRGGASDLELAWAVHYALSSKAAGHYFLDAGVKEHGEVAMSGIGG